MYQIWGTCGSILYLVENTCLASESGEVRLRASLHKGLPHVGFIVSQHYVGWAQNALLSFGSRKGWTSRIYELFKPSRSLINGPKCSAVTPERYLMLSSLWKCYLCSTTITHKERYTHQKSELPSAIRFYLQAVLFTAMAQSFEWIIKASSAAMERLTSETAQCSWRQCRFQEYSSAIKKIAIKLN